jgi:Uncharacterized protein conserved in bacteria C-term(DUF2220)
MNWQTFKSLYELYESGKTKFRSTLAEDAVFKYHSDQTKELLFTRKEISVVDENFKNTFQTRYLKKYNDCLAFLDGMGLNTPYCKFEVDDVLVLRDMKFQMDAGQLNEIQEQIIQSNETRRGVSLMFFKNEKHLDTREALENAVKLILKVDDFADNRDFQYLYVLHCLKPQKIVLCENLHFLKMPGKPRENQIELWYAGGRNIEKLSYTDRRGLPIYYLCDWDYDGLDIFRAVKEKIPEIILLTPNGEPRDIIKTEHKSLWRNQENLELLSGLPLELFSNEQKQLIKTLIKGNSWVIEESNNLIEITPKN